jgi:hypothetical protein
MAMRRHGQTATLLDGGKVLVIGGTESGGYLASAELFVERLPKTQTSSTFRNTTRADVASGQVK